MHMGLGIAQNMQSVLAAEEQKKTAHNLLQPSYVTCIFIRNIPTHSHKLLLGSSLLLSKWGMRTNASSYKRKTKAEKLSGTVNCFRYTCIKYRPEDFFLLKHSLQHQKLHNTCSHACLNFFKHIQNNQNSEYI